jgi:hypothetical protein
MSEDNDWKISGWQEAGGAALVFNAIGQASRERAVQGKLQQAVNAANDTNVILRRFETERLTKDASTQALFRLWKAVNSVGTDNAVSNDQLINIIVLSRVIDEQGLGFFELIEFNRLQSRVIEIAKNSGLKDAVALLANQKTIMNLIH